MPSRNRKRRGGRCGEVTFRARAPLAWVEVVGSGFACPLLPGYTRARLRRTRARRRFGERIVRKGTPAMPRVAKLTIDEKTLELPVVVGSEGEVGIDIAKLRGETGAVTFDPAYGNTGACKSAITFIDGDKGYLRYRGVPIEQLAERSDFIEVAYLLIFGKFPTAAQRKAFSQKLSDNAPINSEFKRVFENFPPTSAPMGALSAMINTAACFNSDFVNPDGDQAQFEEAAARLISKTRTIAAYIYRMAQRLPYLDPEPGMPYVDNFLHMM